MSETTKGLVERSDTERLAITRGTMNLLESWGLHADEMLALLKIDSKPRQLAKYRYSTPFPNEPGLMRRIEYLIRIDDALRTTYPTNPTMGKRWLRQRNHKFNRHSPLAMMMDDGEQGLAYVLSRLDCTYAWEQSGSTPC
jgi:hypothetical protein